MNANESGKQLEKEVKEHFKKFKIKSIPYRTFKEIPFLHPKCLITNAPYISVFGQKGRTEFIWHDEFKEINARIECKRQTTCGSKQECICYFLESCINMPENKIYLIMDGEGWRYGLKQAIKQNIKKKSKKLKKLFDCLKALTNLGILLQWYIINIKLWILELLMLT
jgi:hypothetical protein